MRNDREIVGKGMCNQHAIERIIMVARQPGGANGVGAMDGKKFRPSAGTPAGTPANSRRAAILISISQI